MAQVPIAWSLTADNVTSAELRARGSGDAEDSRGQCARLLHIEIVRV